jgi:hypothetical protein
MVRFAKQKLLTCRSIFGAVDTLGQWQGRVLSVLRPNGLHLEESQSNIVVR